MPRIVGAAINRASLRVEFTGFRLRLKVERETSSQFTGTFLKLWLRQIVIYRKNEIASCAIRELY